jgi:ketosteroid isomerase-like protein
VSVETIRASEWGNPLAVTLDALTRITTAHSFAICQSIAKKIYRSYKHRCTAANREERIVLKFRTIETVKVEDSERVLAVLEQRLRAMVSIVVRDGNRITLLGLGPSSRAINQHDTTVIDVWVEDGATTIGAEVTFQASAFLAATSQEEIMRLKLERLFEETREQLDLESRHDVARIARMEALVGGGSSASRRAAGESHDTQQSSEDNLAKGQSSTEKDSIDDAAAEVSVTRPSSKEETPSHGEDISAASQIADALDDVEDKEPIDNIYDSHDENEEKSNRWILWAVLGACITAVLPFAVHYFSTLRAGMSPAVVAEPQPVTTEPAKPVAAAEPADLLRQWELAMRSRDAAAQAAFYAIPVERYFLRHNVSKAQIEADKQQQIDNRKGAWTVKMEKVKINRKADNTATVTLLKHYTQQEDGKPIKEWLVPSQLKLKNEFGVWWITSERNLFATPSSVTPYAP